MSNHLGPVLRAIKTFNYPPSILKIREFVTDKCMSLSFNYNTQENTCKTLKNLDKKKRTCQENDILVKIIKLHNDIFSYFIHHNFNNSLLSSIFPSEWKRAGNISIHKKKSKFDIKIYRPVSIVSVITKIYERCMFDQRYSYFNQILSKHQCRFRQGHSTQHSLLLMVEKLK